MFSGCTVSTESKETKLGSSDQVAFSSAGKDTTIVLVLCCLWKCVLTAISDGVNKPELKLDKFESHNFVKLSFTKIWGLRSKFIECESFLESNCSDSLALCETNLDDFVSGSFSVRGFLPLIRNDYVTHTHGFAVYVKEGVPFHGTYLLKTLWSLVCVFN